jgi:hypothetical protein
MLLVVVLLLNALISGLRRWRERLDGGTVGLSPALAA